MKVVEKGSKNQKRCDNCGSLLEFSSADVTRKSVGRDEDGDELYLYTIKCTCGAKLNVSSQIGSHFKEEIARRETARDCED